jgi:hypothetical protein
MGRRHKRVIVQADLTSEEDKQFLAWVMERRRKRRLAEEIREGLRLQYRRRTGRGQATAPMDEPATELEGVIIREPEPAAVDTGSVASKLQRLVGGF